MRVHLVLLVQVRQYPLVALQAAVAALHRVQHQGAVGVAAPAVVGKDRIRGMGCGAVFMDQHPDPMLAQRRDVAVELLQSLGLHVFGGTGRALKMVVAGSVLVKRKTRGANHQNAMGSLHGARNQ